MTDADELSDATYSVLGMLSFGSELTGYDLFQWARNMRYFYWNPAQSQIYAALRRLRALGYVTERTQPVANRPDKRLYVITDAGLAALRAWLATSPVEPPLLRHSIALRLFFGHQADPATLRQTLIEYADTVAARLDELRDLATGLGDQFGYPAMVAGWGVRYYQAELASVRDMLRRLKERESRA